MHFSSPYFLRGALLKNLSRRKLKFPKNRQKKIMVSARTKSGGQVSQIFSIKYRRFDEFCQEKYQNWILTIFR